MKKGSIIMIMLGCICVVLGLLPLFLYSELISNRFFMLGGMLLIIIGIFRNKGYFNKNYFMAIFSVIALWGLMLLYIFLFRTNEYLESKNIFYLQIGLFVLLIITFGGPYIRRLKKGNL
ncbi:MAG: hypothetical protein A4E27_00345 [Methanobacterium sp. PtaU1.Bin242]|nr:MAG: hypothetical protein A4E27_00345 [Methanobacterium sp. PtaU1.Bin242]